MRSNLKKLDNLSIWLNKYRPWIYKRKSFTPDNHLLKKNELNFTLMSYNILSQDYLQKYPNLYSFCPPNVLKWPDRGRRVLNEIQINNPDILCLQEVHIDHYTDFYAPELRKNGYDSLFKLRETRFDGAAIFFKKTKFNLLKSKEIDLKREDLTKILTKDNVGLIAMLEPVEDETSKINNCLVVATTHILFNPPKGDIKLAQSRLLLAEIEKMAYRKTDKNGLKSYFPILFAGDFNMLPNSSIYKFIENGILDCNNLDSFCLSGQLKVSPRRFMGKEKIEIKTISSDTEFLNENKLDQNKSNQLNCSDQFITHNLNLKSVFKSKNRLNQHFVTTKHNEANEMVDYVFYHQTKELDLIAFRKLLSENKAFKLVPYLPNELIGSDHFSLVVKFVLRNKKSLE